MSSVGSVDASAAAWAEATLSAAEAYAQEQADNAARERDLNEQRAAAMARDGIDPPPPPTAADRAWDAFYRNDPNRPAGGPSGTASGGGSSGGNPYGTPISEQDAKILADAGYKVVRDDNGTPYLEGNTETVSTTQQAEPEATPTRWLPGYGDQPTTAPPPPPAPPPSEEPGTLSPPPPETEGVDKPANPTSKDKPVDPKRLEEFLKNRPKDFRDRVSYDPKLQDNGATLPNGKVKLGPSAFTSEAQLKSTLDHEQKHVDQLYGGRFPKSKDHVSAVAVSQIEAYRTELANGDKNGLSDSERKQIEKDMSVELEYLRRYDPQYYRQVQNGNYELRPEDAAPIPSN